MSWHALHLFYHEDRDRLLREFVSPCVIELWKEKLFKRFFFIRFPVGGPHLRLRFELPEDASVGRVFREALAEHLDTYLEQRPSQSPVAEETIRRQSDSVLRNDPNEGDTAIYPDNSWAEHPYRPELERYGGAERLELAHDFFAVSSAQALGFADAVAEAPSGVRLSAAGALLWRQSWGFASDPDELIALLEYAVGDWGEPLRRVREHAEGVYAADGEPFLQLVGDALRRRLAAEERGDADPLANSVAARALSTCLASAPPETRWRALTSQLHMSANRLGLQNPDEVFLGRLLGLATRELADHEPALWKEASERLAASQAAASQAATRAQSTEPAEILRQAAHLAWDRLAELNAEEESKSAGSSGEGGEDAAGL